MMVGPWCLLLLRAIAIGKRRTALKDSIASALRPSVIFRKVTGGFRAEWGTRAYAAAVSIIATGRLHGLTAFEVSGHSLRAGLATSAAGHDV